MLKRTLVIELAVGKMTVFFPLIKEIKFWLAKYRDSNKYSEYENLISQWRPLLQGKNHRIEEGYGQNILFITGYGLGAHYYTLEPILMQALKQRGAKVSSLICGQSLPACEFNTNGNNEPRVRFQQRNGLLKSTITSRCNLCNGNSREVLRELDIDIVTIGNYLSQDDYIVAKNLVKHVDLKNFRNFEFDDIAVGEEAFASILRATFKGEVGESKSEDYLKKRYLIAGILTSKAYFRAFSKLKPKKIICIHGVYQIHGLAVKVAKKLGIPIDVIGSGGIRKNTIIACHGQTYHHQLINEDNAIWSEARLTESQVLKTLKYAKDKRNSGSGVDYTSYHPNPIEDSSALLSALNISKEDTIIAAYTNVIWDAQVVYSSNVFNDIFDWLWTTIDTIATNKKIILVIRIHPAETKGGVPTRQPMLAEIQKRYPTLPENVKIIPPSSDLSSYTLASMAKANIIYGTKMGLEIALMKSPLIIAGETFSRNKGYGYDVTSKKKYIEILKDLNAFVGNINIEKCYDKALKYAHYFYFRRMLDLPLKDENLNFKKTTKLNFSELNSLDPGNSEALDTICNGILKNTEFYLK